VSYAKLNRKYIKNIADGLISAGCKKLEEILNWNERFIKLDYSLYTMKFFIEKHYTNKALSYKNGKALFW
jgi:hypothetical protein